MYVLIIIHLMKHHKRHFIRREPTLFDQFRRIHKKKLQSKLNLRFYRIKKSMSFKLKPVHCTHTRTEHTANFETKFTIYMFTSVRRENFSFLFLNLFYTLLTLCKVGGLYERQTHSHFLEFTFVLLCHDTSFAKFHVL